MNDRTEIVAVSLLPSTLFVTAPDGRVVRYTARSQPALVHRSRPGGGSRPRPDDADAESMDRLLDLVLRQAGMGLKTFYVYLAIVCILTGLLVYYLGEDISTTRARGVSLLGAVLGLGCLARILLAWRSTDELAYVLNHWALKRRIEQFPLRSTARYLLLLGALSSIPWVVFVWLTFNPL